jgi:hypothetical protein
MKNNYFIDFTKVMINIMSDLITHTGKLSYMAKSKEVKGVHLIGEIKVSSMPYFIDIK